MSVRGDRIDRRRQTFYLHDRFWNPANTLLGRELMRSHPPILVICVLLSLSGCQCADDNPGWELYEDFGFEDDLASPVEDMPPDATPDVVVLPENDAGWTPEEIEPDVPIEHALNERTSLAVDRNGTIYLGYHRCEDPSCSRVFLTVGRKPRGGDWTFERVKRQRGTFGIEVTNPEEVVAAFLDPTDNTFKVSRRLGADDWEFRTLGVRRTGPSDGLDLTPDSDRMFVTFANERGDPVALYVLSQGEWSAQPTLDIGDASAAYERGLKADGQGNLYLVHRNGSFGAPWGLARYSLRDGEWKERTYYERRPRPRPSSFVVTRTGELCIAGDVNNRNLTVTCGDMVNLSRDRWDLDEEVALGAGGYSSMLEGTDGSLYVAYPSQGNTELRLARKTPDDQWSFETVFEKNAYGVSTIIDSEDLLVISYYTCGDSRCSLEVISRPQVTATSTR